MNRASRRRISRIRMRLKVVGVIAACAGALATLSACQSSRRDPPLVQPSSPAGFDRDVTVDTSAKFVPSCLVIRLGQTVEWRTLAPDVPVNVTSVFPPIELYSPNLQAPLRCDRTAPDRVCWRHSFRTAGCFEYFDTNSGDPGRTVVDPYYGTRKGVGEGGTATRGLVCVEESGSGACAGLCCDTRFDCPSVPGKTFDCVSNWCTDRDTKRGVPCAAKP